MTTYSTNEIVDAVVIGTGAGGAPLLARLASRGLSVVALEAGPQCVPNEFATDEVAQHELYWLDERLSAGKIAFGINNSGKGVGGSTLHFGAYVPRGQPRDFRLHRETGVGVDWPLTYQDLVPYYRELEQFLGVSGPSRYPWCDDEGIYPLPPLPYNAPSQLMERGCKRVGIETAPAPIAALSQPYHQPEYGTRWACQNRGYCHQGCRNGAKASMDVTYLPAAIGAGAEVRPDAFAYDLERDRSGQISAVIYQRHGAEYKQPCRHVFLCGGAIETPRLLLRLNLANSSGQVGRNFMAHVATQVWGTFEEETRPYKGFPASVISERTCRRGEVDFASRYLLQSLGIVPGTWAVQVARGRGLFGHELISYLRQYNHVAGIGINGDCLPAEGNYLELSDELDGRGFPKPRIHFKTGPNEQAMRDNADGVMRSIWEAAGARDIWTFERSAHTIGTCRMGYRADDAVVDPFGRSFEIKNLWISDNSTFPSALPVNPALTIMALSLRTADCFLTQ